MISSFLTFYVAQKVTRMMAGGIFGLAKGMRNREVSTSMKIAYENSKKMYQNSIGRTVTEEEFKGVVHNKVNGYQKSLISAGAKRLEPDNFEGYAELIPHLEKTQKVCKAAFKDLGLRESNLIVSFYERSNLGASVNGELKFIGNIPVYSMEFDIPKDQQFSETFYRKVYAVSGHEAIHTTQLVAQDTISLMRNMSLFFAFPLISLYQEEYETSYGYGSIYATPSLISKIFEIDADLRSSIHLKTAGDLKKHFEEDVPLPERNESSPTHPSPATRIKYLDIISQFQGENSSLFFKAYHKIQTLQKMSICQNQIENPEVLHNDDTKQGISLYPS